MRSGVVGLRHIGRSNHAGCTKATLPRSNNVFPISRLVTLQRVVQPTRGMCNSTSGKTDLDLQRDYQGEYT